jgi:hypothetical protein
MRCHASVLEWRQRHLSPFIGVELTCWKARTLPQVAAVFDEVDGASQGIEVP